MNNTIECLTPDVKWFTRTLPPCVIKYKIKDEQLLSSLIDAVDSDGDRMRHQTNLACAMTSYRSQEYSTHKSSFENTINLFSEIFKQNNLKIEVVDIWVAKYVSQDYAKKHNHGDALWSFCIYLNEGKDFPPIELEGYGKVKAEKGLVIFFPYWVFHSVESKEFEGARYVCAGNIYTKGQR